MTENNLLWGSAGAIAVWWWLHRGCKCDDHAAASTPAPTPPPPTPAPPSPMATPFDVYAQPICPPGYDASEGGSCARNVVLTIPGYPAPIAQIEFAPSICPDGYAKEASSGGCKRV